MHELFTRVRKPLNFQDYVISIDYAAATTGADITALRPVKITANGIEIVTIKSFAIDQIKSQPYFDDE